MGNIPQVGELYPRLSTTAKEWNAVKIKALKYSYIALHMGDTFVHHLGGQPLQGASKKQPLLLN